MKEHMNYTLLCDFYELTMGNGYFQTEGYAEQICYFDIFFRKIGKPARNISEHSGPNHTRTRTLYNACANVLAIVGNHSSAIHFHQITISGCSADLQRRGNL